MNRKWIGLAAILVLLGIAFAALDFHLATSNTHADKQVATASGGNAHPRQPQEVGVYVTGDDALASGLRAGLLRRLPRYPAVASVRLLDKRPEQQRAPALLVELGDRTGFWTPVFSQTRTKARVTYASDGVMAWHSQESLTGGNALTVRSYGEIELQDSTAGLTSYTGYHRLLGERLAEEVCAALEKPVLNPAQ